MTEVDPTAGLVHTFAGGDLDRAAHVRADRARVEEMRGSPAARFLPFRDGDPLVAGGEAFHLAWLSHDELRAVGAGAAEAVFLGVAGPGPRFAVKVPDSVRDDRMGPADAAFRGTRSVASRLTAEDASIVALGRSLVLWNATHGHCPRCGHSAVAEQAGHARRCSRSECGTIQFPSTDPVVIMLIHRAGRCLLGRAVRANRYPPGLHSCLAGYVEPGESIEEAVRRETWEEAGLRVDGVRYHSSQPWPFPSTLMIGCFAHALPGDPRIDRAELESVRWFTREELHRAVERWDVENELRVPPPLTIAHQLARAWLAETADPDRPFTED